MLTIFLQAQQLKEHPFVASRRIPVFLPELFRNLLKHRIATLHGRTSTLTAVVMCGQFNGFPGQTNISVAGVAENLSAEFFARIQVVG